jgi:hypothetical protein
MAFEIPFMTLWSSVANLSVDTTTSANFDYTTPHALTGVSTTTSTLAVAVWKGYDSAAPSISGGGLSWTVAVSLRDTNSGAGIVIWTAPLSTQLSGATITVTPVQGNANGHLTVIGVAGGAATVGSTASFSTSSGQVVATSITTTGTGSLVFSGWTTNTVLASPVWASGNAVIDMWAKVDGNYATGRLTGTVNAGTYTVGLTSNAPISGTIAAVEIKVA